MLRTQVGSGYGTWLIPAYLNQFFEGASRRIVWYSDIYHEIAGIRHVDVKVRCALFPGAARLGGPTVGGVHLRAQVGADKETGQVGSQIKDACP